MNYADVQFILERSKQSKLGQIGAPCFLKDVFRCRCYSFFSKLSTGEALHYWKGAGEGREGYC